MRSISPYSVRMGENADQNNNEYGQFLRSESVREYPYQELSFEKNGQWRRKNILEKWIFSRKLRILSHLLKKSLMENFIYMQCNLQSWPKYMRQILVLVWNSALREKVQLHFLNSFLLVLAKFSFGGELGAGLKLHGDLRSSQYFLIF